MSDPTLPLATELVHLDALAQQSLALWHIPAGARTRRLNVAENVTYLIEGAGGYRRVLRIHREGYHSLRAIECELAWIDALHREGRVETPAIETGRNGARVQIGQVAGLPKPRFMVLFQFVAGCQPDPNHDLVAPFRILGSIAARTHLHAIAWQKPDCFERLTWDLDAVFGPHATWGDWRDAPGITPAIRLVLEPTEALVRARLAAFGKGADRYGLIHADMRLANLLIDGSTTRLIDFDDCGFGWFMYDFAAAISFIEDHPQVPVLKAAWVDGYQRVRRLQAADLAEIDTFIMLRRMALLAWIGSHIDAPEPQRLAPDFARVTRDLAQTYLGAAHVTPMGIQAKKKTRGQTASSLRNKVSR
ncbi:MAG: phosphotransferase [Pseudorhodobacter sp.]|nr:phosphotransferase [Pseudorhodobacter sp.]